MDVIFHTTLDVVPDARELREVLEKFVRENDDFVKAGKLSVSIQGVEFDGPQLRIRYIRFSENWDH